jgi:hypothetical protein
MAGLPGKRHLHRARRLPGGLRPRGRQLRLFNLTGQGQTGGLDHVVLDVEQLRGMVRAERGLDRTQQALGLIASTAAPNSL